MHQHRAASDDGPAESAIEGWQYDMMGRGECQDEFFLDNAINNGIMCVWLGLTTSGSESD
jgi:hypothetical protein